MGLITDSESPDEGRYCLSLAAAVDGSEVPDLVLAVDTDASSDAMQTLAYSRGDFNENALVLGTGYTGDAVREGLRVKGIVLLPAQAA